MKYAKEFATIVIVGQWNNAIITKEWITRHTSFPKVAIKEEISLDLNGSNRVSSKDFRISSVNGRLEFTILNVNESTLELLKDISIELSKVLLHTPVRRFGINFKYVLETKKEKLSMDNILNFIDSRKLEQNELALDRVELKRSFFISDGIKLNLNIAKIDSNYLVDFNYDFEIKNLFEFAEKISKYSPIDLEKKTLEILKKNYGLAYE